MADIQNLLQEISLLSSTSATLGWDQETYAPAKSVAHRAKQLAYLHGRIHKLQTSNAFRDGLASLAGRNQRELTHRYERATKIPQELVERDSETSSLAKAAWSEARKKDQFQTFAPHLAKLLEIAREKADHWGYEDEPYDALLSEYERGAKTREVAALFDSIDTELAQIAAAAVEKSSSIPADFLHGPAPIEAQQTLNREVAESLGFDFTQGRIDTTAHPFCTTLGPADVRLTTRYEEHDFASSLFGVMHETGHGLYEQGLPASDFHLPSGHAVSLGIHESQSRLWENHVGRSRPFWEKWYPRTQSLFPHLREISLDDFLPAVNRCAYSPIRVEADEATYDLHILLRFKIERALLTGELEVAGVPATWNDEFEKLFGFRPKTDSEGCLQDIHWSMGGLGYFATYSLGNINSAQLFEAAMKDDAVSSAFAKGDFLPLLGWMQKNIHQYGSTLFPQDLMAQATGSKTDPQSYLKHLRSRFSQ
ncbi:carboxypeptidase M32 [Akkermansiaceae bacterium]|nr:carboxypeptidase M32 [Akkermansiaceae bacterium]MDA7891890.1 carboxypeptidase M32 [Akkermansiaceae bacterium]MDA9831800.1 carboxypeptidase M32 [Akkermansiaceae bacterium]MDB4382991.1 carboxypeptidase M32 [Akkermansiaceae bacterium]